MAGRFFFPDSSPTPSTPDRSSRIGTKKWDFAEPSTTPAAPPPEDDTAASFTPAGAPSASYLGSSIMRGVQGTEKSSAAPNTGATSRSLFRGGDSSRPPKNQFGVSSATSNSANSPLGRSVSGGTGFNPINRRGPSSLSNQYLAEDDENPDGQVLPQGRPTTYKFDYSDEEDTGFDDTIHEDDAEGEEGEDAEGEGDTQQHDYFMDEAARDEYVPNAPVPYLDDDNETDLMIATSHANQRVLQEAEDLFQASTKFARLSVHRDLVYARQAKAMHSEVDFAELRENDDVVLKTEELVSRLYDEGVGASDDPDKLDNALAMISSRLNNVWQEYLHTLDDSVPERSPSVGPGRDSDNFRKSRWLASLVLQMHHTRYSSDYGVTTPSLPEIMVYWIKDEHDVYSKAQLLEIARFRPSPACHQLFWNSVINSIARGMVSDASKLLTEAGWELVRTHGSRGDFAYSGQSLQNLQHAVQVTTEMLQSCPGFKENWDIHGSEWTLFRIKAKNARDQLVRFAEGKDRVRGMNALRFESGQASISNLAREAESKVPWDVYKNLQSIFDIVLGKQEAITAACQDWCEASVALMVWLDEGVAGRPMDLSRSQNLSRSMQLAPATNTPESYNDRLVRCFHMAVEEFPLNPVDFDEITYACAFEGNYEGVVSGLRTWSLPIASAVAEVASLGGWLPPAEPKNLITMDSLQQEDMELLGMDSRGPDETDGLKDTTLVEYAKELVGLESMHAVFDNQEIVREGWEVAVEVLGRMDSRAKSEDMVRQVLENVLEKISLDSSSTIDKVWSLLNALGMITFAEETVESYADLLSRESHRYGEALWYYALGHRPNKVREVLNLMMSYSLMHSTVFPADEDLDDYLNRLLTQRSTTLEKLAKTDLEAAELLGKMLAGYATLRKFYELRDGVADASPFQREGSVSPGSQGRRPPAARQQAAAALVAVIASSDDNIRGGLYDNTRDAVVSEDFILALLGEALMFLQPASMSASLLGDNEPDLTLEQLDVLFKAVEDIQTVGTRVFDTADEFFKTVIASSPGISNPKDMLKSVPSGSGGGLGSGSSSFVVMSGSSMFASQLHKSFHAATAKRGEIHRGWDWRGGIKPGMGARDVLRLMRLGLSREVARLWVVQADSVML
ncbi:nuclear pore complex subunit nup85 [Zalerion maritima]|uniref:Nuclear pore complex protein Nup85 n=1 Tax=Zalerion maritima TaxID=339359 RepID=A0AAD5RKS8_9PEZI|nr:nuclear pore complex subunit nup85 [Zalerion maritima]